MQKSKFIQYLSGFSKQDLRLFKDFVHSPYFNKHQKTRELFDYILKVKKLDSPLLEKEKVFTKIFPNKTYNEQNLRTLLSYLVQLVYQFYSQKYQETNPAEQKIGLLETALQNGQKSIFKHQSLNWEKNHQQSPIRNSNYYLQFSRFQRLQDEFDINYGKRSSGSFLEKALTNFDTYYIAEKLKMTCEMLARKQVTGQDYSFSFLQELITFLEKEKNHFESIPGVWIYLLIYKMIKADNSKHFFELKSRLKKDVHFFNHQEGRDLYTHALNYCIGKLNFGETSFKKETFELYQQMLDNGLLYIDKVLPQWDYTNIVSLGCDLEESEWIKNFIIKQKEFLPKAERENTYTYNLAAYLYAQKEYSEAIRLLQKVTFTEVYNNLLTRILLLKIYFETQDWQALEYFLETFRIYLIRNKQLGESRRKSGLNLIKYTRNLFRLLESKPTLTKETFLKKRQTLKKQIENNEKVLNKSWLLSVV